ncbi:hypothetical protein [Methylophilus sp. OH31]|uniref:hypothetical protein n=1 Tax=Methylophilus sp. OH31 TaxID=1387312 RepID=UPI0004667F61|nr:hypothetical protein [Methylophilus sp. OH31]
MPDHPQIDIKVNLVRESKLDIYIYVDEVFTDAAVRHFLSLGNNTVRIDDIYGAGPGSRWHRKGLGALAVNTAIQFLKTLYAPATTLHGHVYDAKDLNFPENERPKLQADRKAFWRTFGYEITAPNAQGDEYLCGTVGNLIAMDKGKVLGIHPRVLNIAQMHFTGK